MFQLIIKNMRKKKIQTLAVLLSVLISVAVLFALALVHNGISAGIETSEERLGADLMVVPAEAEESLDDADILFTGTAANYYIDESVIDEIESIKGVKRTTSQFFCQTLSSSECCTSGLEARIIGFDPETDWVIGPWMHTSLSELSDDEVVIGAEVLSGADDDTILILNKTFRIASRLDRTGTSLDYSLMMDIDSARKLASEKAEYAHFWEANGDPQTMVTAVLVELEEDASADSTATLISYKTGTTVVKSGSALAEIQGQMNVIFTLMLGAALLLGLASVIQLFARFYTMAWDRRNEFGLYRALGARRSTLRFLVFGEMLLLVVGGTVLGLLVGYALFQGILSLIASQSAFPFIAPDAFTLALGSAAILLLMVAIGLIATAAPVHQLNRISPTLAMQRGNID